MGRAVEGVERRVKTGTVPSRCDRVSHTARDIILYYINTARATAAAGEPAGGQLIRHGVAGTKGRFRPARPGRIIHRVTRVTYARQSVTAASGKYNNWVVHGDVQRHRHGRHRRLCACPVSRTTATNLSDSIDSGTAVPVVYYFAFIVCYRENRPAEILTVHAAALPRVKLQRL